MPDILVELHNAHRNNQRIHDVLELRKIRDVLHEWSAFFDQFAREIAEYFRDFSEVIVNESRVSVYFHDKLVSVSHFLKSLALQFIVVFEINVKEFELLSQKLLPFSNTCRVKFLCIDLHMNAHSKFIDFLHRSQHNFKFSRVDVLISLVELFHKHLNPF